MNGIIIENEYEVDESIQAFLKDNPDLFTNIQEELYCLHRDIENLIPEILKNDAIIVASTWVYKDQLQDFLEKFNKFPKGKTYQFFVHRIVEQLNEWNDPNEIFKNLDIVTLVKSLLNKGFEIYDFFEDWDSKETVIDELNFTHKKMQRNLCGYWKVCYDTKSNLFYLKNNKYYSLKEIKNEKKS